MMSQKLEQIINTAIRLANEKRHEYLTLETILMSLILDDLRVVSILEQCGADIPGLRHELDSFLNDNENFSILSDNQIEELSLIQGENIQVTLPNGKKVLGNTSGFGEEGELILKTVPEPGKGSEILEISAAHEIRIV